MVDTEAKPTVVRDDTLAAVLVTEPCSHVNKYKLILTTNTTVIKTLKFNFEIDLIKLFFPTKLSARNI
jgi:hypothetical protein